MQLLDAGVRGRMFMGIFFHGTQSQVRCSSSLSEPWGSPLLFNSSSAQLRLCELPLVQFCSSSLLSAECEFDLQVALDVVARWGRQWRFSFGPGVPSLFVLSTWANCDEHLCLGLPTRALLELCFSVFTSSVLPSISWGSEFFSSSPLVLRVIDSALRCRADSL